MKLMLCIALHLYSGSDGGTELTRSCKEVSVASARKQIDHCVKEGVTSCEVILSADKRTFTIEKKIGFRP